MDSWSIKQTQTPWNVYSLNELVPILVTFVKIAISLLISDTKHERNYLMEKAYPKLKSFCKQLGYEFQVGVSFSFSELIQNEITNHVVCALLSIVRCLTLKFYQSKSWILFLSVVS